MSVCAGATAEMGIAPPGPEMPVGPAGGALALHMPPEIWSYSAIVQAMRRRYHLRVRKWRRSMSGCAWRVYHHDGRVVNWVEAPYPKTPISVAIFLHEVGHHVIGFERYKKRCEEEYHVWVWAISEMRKLGVQPDERVRR